MNIEGIIWINQIVDKLAFKHQIETNEVEEIFTGKPKFRFVEKGERKDENVYMALGQTVGGRYLTVLFIYKLTKEALILSARDMAHRERKMYDRK
ncbi:MAG: BrnT family toxin [Acidobacteriota bacterium]|nr:BrnT family toxin [Acidobacteriota bacterium]